MRILHTVSYYAPDNGGGAEAVVRQVSEGLVQRGHAVTVATTFSPRRRVFEQDGVRIEQFAIYGVLNQSVLGIYGDTTGYLNYLQSADFDIIMNYAAQTWHTDLTCQVLGQLRAKTVLAACGYSGLIPPRSILYRRYFRRLPKFLKQYDAVVYHSANYRDKQFGDQHGISNYRVIPNGINQSEFEQSVIDFRHHYQIQTRYLILCVGNHYQNKGHQRVINAFTRLHHDDVTLVIIGGNPAAWYRSCWASCSKAAASHDRILLLDNAPRAHVVAAYRAADVFVSGSHVEVFPLVIVESMAANVPFVAFPAGNIEELRGGVIVQSVQDMANQINCLLDNESKRRELGQLGGGEQRAKYEWRAIVGQYESLYRDLLDLGERSNEYLAH
jgi:L-malate glycosyltransferase